MNVQRIAQAVLLVLLAGPTSPDSSPALAGIAHVAFRVTDVQKSREFYRALGFEQAFEFADPGKPLVSYVKINDRQFIELYGRAEDSQSTGLMHVCYEASDIETLWREYAQQGLNPPASKKARAGNLLFMFRDPEGQLLEYTQYLPGSLHFEDRGKHLGDRRVSEHLLRAVIAVKDTKAEESFYTSELSFENIDGVGGGVRVDGSETIRLRLPGTSGEEIELESATPMTKPRIVFTVGNLVQTADDLRSRGLTVKLVGDSVSVADPDGVLIVFTLAKNPHPAKSVDALDETSKIRK
jgi:catechol 2,3-dioxygenase-like lactoylglutathione lyase family enzyme